MAPPHLTSPLHFIVVIDKRFSNVALVITPPPLPFYLPLLLLLLLSLGGHHLVVRTLCKTLAPLQRTEMLHRVQDGGNNNDNNPAAAPVQRTSSTPLSTTTFLPFYPSSLLSPLPPSDHPLSLQVLLCKDSDQIYPILISSPSLLSPLPSL